jgi:hypothetical protein
MTAPIMLINSDECFNVDRFIVVTSGISMGSDCSDYASNLKKYNARKEPCRSKVLSGSKF